ncbi:hypothetical protein ACFLZM_07235 [Thermodesulfobacteriota bacterium]
MDKQLKWISDRLAAKDDLGTLFLATHAAEGAKIISSIKDSGKAYSIIGPDTFSEKDFMDRLKQYPRERSTPGYYSDGIFSVSPFMIGIADNKATAFGQQFFQKFKQKPSGSAACYYDAVHVAVSAIKKAGIAGRGKIRGDRTKVRDALASFYDQKTAVKGITGDIFFNKNGDVNRPYAMGKYQNQRLLPAFFQYQQIENPKGVPDIFEKVLSGEFIVIDRKLMNKFNVIFTDVEINDISNLDIHRSRCTLDFYIWFQYSEDLKIGRIEFTNSAHPIYLENPVAEKTFNRITTRLYRVRAEFKTDFNLHAYPFISHVLPIRFRYTSNTDDRLIHVADISGLSELRIRRNGEQKTEFSALPGWHIKEMSYYRDNILKNTSLGHPIFSDATHRTSMGQFNVQIRLEKERGKDIIKIFLPSIIMLAVLYLIYFVPPHRLMARMLVGMAVMITNATFHLKLLSDIPVAYLTFLEYVLLTIYLFISMSVFISVIIYRTHQRGDAVRSANLMRAGRIIYPCLMLTLAFAIIIIYYLSI